MLIGETAKKAEVNIETIRYYERKGILALPKKSASGYREYSGETVAKIKFVKNAQYLGFSLKEIQDLLALKVDKNSDCSDVKSRALSKISEIKEKITALKEMQKSLEVITHKCSGKGPVSTCTILNAIDEGQ